MSFKKKHFCNTEHPELPCCWEKRKQEFDLLDMAEKALIEKYGSSHCKNCNKKYGVDVIELFYSKKIVFVEHVCKPLTDEQIWK